MYSRFDQPSSLTSRLTLIKLYVIIYIEDKKRREIYMWIVHGVLAVWGGIGIGLTLASGINYLERAWDKSDLNLLIRSRRNG